MRHAYAGQPGKSLLIEIELGDKGIVLRLLHEGRQFDPAVVRPPVFDGSRDGGVRLAADIASAGVMRICVHASERIIGILTVGLVPGLKSVAKPMMAPASISLRAGA